MTYRLPRAEAARLRVRDERTPPELGAAPTLQDPLSFEVGHVSRKLRLTYSTYQHRLSPEVSEAVTFAVGFVLPGSERSSTERVHSLRQLLGSFSAWEEAAVALVTKATWGSPFTEAGRTRLSPSEERERAWTERKVVRAQKLGRPLSALAVAMQTHMETLVMRPFFTARSLQKASVFFFDPLLRARDAYFKTPTAETLARYIAIAQELQQARYFIETLAPHAGPETLQESYSQLETLETSLIFLEAGV